jgi:hypothetical protein
LLLASFILLLLICLLLLPILISLLLSRRRPVIASWLRPLTWRIRLWRVSGFVRRIRRRIRRLSGIAHRRLAVSRLIVRTVSIRLRLLSRGSLLHLWPLGRNIRWTQSLDFAPSERFAGVSRKCPLLFFKRHRRWRRRRLGYDGPLRNCRGRPGHPICG